MPTLTQPICPEQKTPYPQDGAPDIFNKSWWLYFYNLGKQVDALGLDLPFVTPEQYGAAGDGVNDDTAAWQATINAAINLNKPIFAALDYLVHKTGASVLPWDGLSHGYVFKLTSAIEILGWGTMIMSVTDAATANVFLFQQVTGARVNGFGAIGEGTAASQKLYDGALFAFDRCTNCLLSDINTSLMRGNCWFFQSSDCEIQLGFSSVHATNKAGSHFASYGCSRVTIRDCTAYGGTSDGDIVHFGENVDGLATANRILNCGIHNYEFGDDTKTIVFDEAQGFLMDSGQDFGIVADSYAHGYFYGIDVKTTCEGVIVRNNTIEKCKVGIAVRRGEGNAQTFNTLITGNQIRPMGGNGNTQDLFDGLTNTVGMWLQDAIGVDIVDNLIEASYLFGAGEQDYIPIYGVKTYIDTPINSVNDGWAIRNNRFANEMNVGGTYSYTKNISVLLRGVASTGTADAFGTGVTRLSGDNFDDSGAWTGLTILLNGTVYIIASVADTDHLTLTGSAGILSAASYAVQNIILRGEVSGNDFKMYSGGNDMTGSPLQVSFATQFSISRNTFSPYGGIYPAIVAANITQLKVDGNQFPQAPGYVVLTACVDVSVCGNQFANEGRNLNTALPVPVIYADGVSNLIVSGNILNQGAATDDGRMVESSASGNGALVLIGNLMNKQLFLVDWFQWNSVSNSSEQNISQSGNVLNGRLAIGSEITSRTWKITAAGGNWLVDDVVVVAHAAATIQTFALGDSLPSYGKIRAVNMTVLTPFAGTGFTAVSAQFSDQTGGAGAYVNIPFDVLTSGNFTDCLPLLASILQTGSNLEVTMTANQNFSAHALTGEFSLTIDWINMTVPVQ